MRIMRSKITVLAGLALLPACTVENNGSIAILANGLPETGEGCYFVDDPTHVLPSGTLDVRYGGSYVMGPIVQNRMGETVTQRTPTTGNEVDSSTERNAITIRAFDVEIELLCSEGDSDCATAATKVDRSFRTPGAATIPPGFSTPISIVAIPADATRDLLASGVVPTGQLGPPIRVRLQAVGGRNPDEELESGSFDYYVDVCDDCLVRGLDPPLSCPGGSAEGYCGGAQDFALDCCWVGQTPYCPASEAPGAQ